MNIVKLKEKLDEHNVESYHYSIDGSAVLEGFCIEKNSKGWVVYYLERGIEKRHEYFKDESSACENILCRILADGVMNKKK